MNRALFHKCIAEARGLLLACSLYAFGFSLVRVFVVSEFDTQRFKSLLDLIPDTFKSFTPVDFEWLVSYTGRIAFTLDEPMLIGCLALWAIARGSDVVAGELSRGTMELLLAQPVSRRAVYWTQSSVTLAGVIVIVLAAWLGMWLGVQVSTVEEMPVDTPWQTLLKPWLEQARGGLQLLFEMLGWQPAEEEAGRLVQMRMQVNSFVFWPGLVNLAALSAFLCGLTAMFSAADRHRWRTIGAVTGLYTAMALLKFVGISLVRLRGCLWLTFFTFYEPEEWIALYERNGAGMWRWIKLDADQQWVGLGPLAHLLILLLLAAAAYAAGQRIFERRDLPPPL